MQGWLAPVIKNNLCLNYSVASVYFPGRFAIKRGKEELLLVYRLILFDCKRL
ncbi:hypothetical protein SDC9_33411 [bioreactor metagenome]|uniref:Uncharacterized protein n=1 Tax=bioreactor metagenome TaxID=1076179 RepID=A0A644V876_9ZZZZ